MGLKGGVVNYSDCALMRECLHNTARATDGLQRLFLVIPRS